jgi:hypothetical protein
MIHCYRPRLCNVPNLVQHPLIALRWSQHIHLHAHFGVHSVSAHLRYPLVLNAVPDLLLDLFAVRLLALFMLAFCVHHRSCVLRLQVPVPPLPKDLSTFRSPPSSSTDASFHIPISVDWDRRL